MTRKLRFAAILVLALIASLAAPGAHAQMGAWRAMAGGMTTPNVNPRQLKVYAKVLGLRPDQTRAAEELLSSYETEYLAAIKRFQEIQQAANQDFMQSGDLQETQAAMQDAIKKFNKKTSGLEQALLDDIKTLLDAGQLERWPQLERLHRRMTTINWGSLSGESVDLFDIVEGLRISAEQAAPLTPVLSQYEIDLDRELQGRNALIQEQMKGFLEGGFANFDFEKMKKQAADLREAGRKIVDLNKRYAQQLQPLVPTDLRTEFADRVKLSSYPIVYRRSYAMRVIEAAEKLPDLDPAQKEALRTIRETYVRDAAAANDQWAAAITDHELNPTDDNPFAQFAPNQQLPEGLKKAKESRDGIDARAIDGVKALLNEQQKAQLPAKTFRPELDFDAAPSEK